MARVAYVVALLGMLALRASASAQDECVGNDDCGPGRGCTRMENLLPPVCAPGQRCNPPPPGPWMCVEDNSCFGDEHCAVDEQCVLGDSIPVACLQPPCPTPSEPERPRGYCRPRPMTCTKDADCAAGLSCEVGEDCPIASKKGTTCEPPQHVCVLRLRACTADADCMAGYGCLAEGERECSSDIVPCTPGQACPPPMVRCSEPTRKCFPKRVDCPQNGDCGPGARCIELPDGGEGLPGYEGATNVCFPEGVALALEGRVEVYDDEDDGSRSSAMAPTAADAREAAPATGASEPSTTQAGGGCGIVPSGPAHGSCLAMLLLAFAFAAQRRRG